MNRKSKVMLQAVWKKRRRTFKDVGAPVSWTRTYIKAKTLKMLVVFMAFVYAKISGRGNKNMNHKRNKIINYTSSKLNILLFRINKLVD